MEQLKMQYLSAKKNYNEKDTLTLSKRMADSLCLDSIEEAIKYLSLFVDDKPINQDNILPDDCNNISPIFKINLIDESICTIIYIFYKLINLKDIDSINYCINLLHDFRDKLIDKISYSNSNTNNLCFCRELRSIIDIIFYLYMNRNIKEEESFMLLSKRYYEFMRSVYEIFGDLTDNYYINLHNFYNKKSKESIVI